MKKIEKLELIMTILALIVLCCSAYNSYGTDKFNPYLLACIWCFNTLLKMVLI
jgi:hypothetical protein